MERKLEKAKKIKEIQQRLELVGCKSGIDIYRVYSLETIFCEHND